MNLLWDREEWVATCTRCGEREAFDGDDWNDDEAHNVLIEAGWKWKDGNACPSCSETIAADRIPRAGSIVRGIHLNKPEFV